MDDFKDSFQRLQGRIMDWTSRRLFVCVHVQWEMRKGEKEPVVKLAIDQDIQREQQCACLLVLFFFSSASTVDIRFVEMAQSINR
jgi:hypothetical protein